ncbi:flagellar hook-length control protein FliK [Neobacillus niacini]|uniref:flagellar hook-length control protein FliK n=1 Tax=Neobacillus niacini TaxID=86668 RepID=UPI0028594020|nr:flagellar hook-length control protein FliK [Neobacillus niacini]MDR7080074.1 flagellar hook-length control protein FliK [Neobacillus niacini]
MIQLSGIQMNGISQTGKMAVKEGEQATGFDALLKLIGQTEEEDAESLGLVNLPLILQQNPLMEPVLKHMSLEIPSFAQAQGAPILAKQVVNSPVPESFVKEPMTSAEKTGEIKLDAATFLHVKEGTGTATEQVVKDLEGLIQNSEDSGQNESQRESQTSKNSPADFFTMVNSSPTNQPIISSEKVKPTTQTVHANQFDQEVARFLISSINVTGMEDGMEAAFTLAPEHLGKVDVKVTIQDGQLTAEFLTSTPLGKELLESHVQALRSALETQGLQVGKIDITQQTSTNLNFMGAFSQKGDSNGRPGQQDSRKRSEPVQLPTQEEYRDYIIDIGWVSQINTTV